MNENGQAVDAQVVEKPVAHKDTLALDSLKTNITTSKESFVKQLVDVKNAIETREEELKVLRIKRDKLSGAIEAAEIFLKQK